LAAASALAGPAHAQSGCEPWPDEPRPLPTLDDPDPLRARWAALRARELDDAAHRLASVDPSRAQALWLHALCIAPEDSEALAGLAAPSSPVTLHRPEVLRGAPAPSPLAAWESLDEPIVVTPAPRPRRARRVDPAAAELDALVEETAELVRRAQFEEALASAERARQRASALSGEARAARSANLEVWAATAALALGREQEARAGLSRALEADPELTLDAGTTSPKVRRALEAVRTESGR
jgi:hypothetical protein